MILTLRAQNIAEKKHYVCTRFVEQIVSIRTGAASDTNFVQVIFVCLFSEAFMINVSI